MITKVRDSNNISKNAIKISAITASAVVPAAYMTQMHIDLFKKSDKPNRSMMRNKMLGFFSGVGLSALLVHKRVKLGNITIVDSKNRISNQAIKIIIAAIAPFAGLELAKRINKKLYPDKF